MATQTETTRRWRISDIDGKNPRDVTLAEYLAEKRSALAKVADVAAAFRAGDLRAMEAAQKKIRAA